MLKPCFSNIFVVFFHKSLNSISERNLFPLWNSWFLACLRSVTNESYLFGNFCCIILVYSVRSNFVSSVIPLGGQRVSYWSLNLHILLFKPTSSWYSFDPSVGRCSWSWSTLRHKYLPAKSIRAATRSHFSYSLNQLLFPADILKMIRYLD